MCIGDELTQSFDWFFLLKVILFFAIEVEWSEKVSARWEQFVMVLFQKNLSMDVPEVYPKWPNSKISQLVDGVFLWNSMLG